MFKHLPGWDFGCREEGCDLEKKPKKTGYDNLFSDCQRDMAAFETVSKSGFDSLWGLKMFPEKY